MRSPKYFIGDRLCLYPDLIKSLIDIRPAAIKDMFSRYLGSQQHNQLPLEAAVATVVARTYDPSTSEWEYIVLPDLPLLWPNLPNHLDAIVTASAYVETPRGFNIANEDAIHGIARSATRAFPQATNPDLVLLTEPMNLGLVIVTEQQAYPLNEQSRLQAPDRDPYRFPNSTYDAKSYAMYCRRPTVDEVQADPFVSAMIPFAFPTAVWGIDPTTYEIYQATSLGLPLWQLVLLPTIPCPYTNVTPPSATPIYSAGPNTWKAVTQNPTSVDDNPIRKAFLRLINERYKPIEAQELEILWNFIYDTGQSESLLSYSREKFSGLDPSETHDQPGHLLMPPPSPVQ